jgi:hypothetical protein
MKIIYFLFLIAVLLGTCLLYAVSGHGNYVPGKNTGGIEVEKIPAGRAETPETREIDYFENPRDVDNWTVERPYRGEIFLKRSAAHSSQGKYSMEVFFRKGGLSNIKLVNFPKEWKNYGGIAFDLYNPGGGECLFSFSAKSDYCNPAKTEKYFCTELRIGPGWNSYRIPVARIKEKMDIGNSQKMLTLNMYSGGRYFYIDNMRLEK